MEESYIKLRVSDYKVTLGYLEHIANNPNSKESNQLESIKSQIENQLQGDGSCSIHSPTSLPDWMIEPYEEAKNIIELIENKEYQQALSKIKEMKKKGIERNYSLT